MINREKPNSKNVTDLQDNSKGNPAVLQKHIEESKKYTEESWDFYYKTVRDLLASGGRDLLEEIKRCGRELLESGAKYIHQVVVPHKPIGKAKLEADHGLPTDATSRQQKENSKSK